MRCPGLYFVEPMTGIEPALSAWEAEDLGIFAQVESVNVQVGR